MAARSIGSGTISLGLVAIPIRLYTATSAKSVGFNMLHKPCGSRVQQVLRCPVENVEIERSDTVRGFEYARDQYVQFTDEEFKALEADRPSVLELLEFVPAATVDLLYIEKTYYLGPDKGGDRAYVTLARALEEAGRCGVGRFANRGKDTLVIVRPYRDGLILHEVYYSNEVVSFDDVPKPEDKPARNEVEMAKLLIAQLDSEGFAADRYRDEYASKVQALVDKKIAGEEIVVPAERPKAQVVDLLEALKRSVAEVEKKAPRATDSSPEPSTVKAKTKGPTKATPRRQAAGEKKRRRADAVS